jgi:hypothetical protein
MVVDPSAELFDHALYRKDRESGCYYICDPSETCFLSGSGKATIGMENKKDYLWGEQIRAYTFYKKWKSERIANEHPMLLVALWKAIHSPEGACPECAVPFFEAAKRQAEKQAKAPK